MIYRPLLAPWNILTKVFLLQHRLLRDLQYNSSRSNSKKNIKLIDGNLLADLLVKYEVGVAAAQTFKLYKLDTELF